ncbi:hypothetical protein LTR86_010209 [Recurvomyces mirabilis]|nr:hypothetical protein LTR86_010209 [Recurvomyces mirabilis]
MSRAGERQGTDEIRIIYSPDELLYRRIELEQRLRGSTSGDATRGASTSSLDRYARSVSPPQMLRTAFALEGANLEHTTSPLGNRSRFDAGRMPAYYAAGVAHARNEEALRMSLLTLEPQISLPVVNTAISAKDGTPRLSSSAALGGNPERLQDNRFMPPSSAGPSTYLTTNPQQPPPRPSHHPRQAISQRSRHGAAVESSKTPTPARPAKETAQIDKRVQADPTRPAGSGSRAPGPASIIPHRAKASPTFELNGAIPLDPQASSHNNLTSKEPSSTGKAAQSSTKVLELITTNLDGSGSPSAEKGPVERTATSNRQSGNDDAHTSEKSASNTQRNMELTESSLRDGAHGGQRELSRKMMVACDSDALEVGVYVEAWSEQVDVMKLTAAPRLVQLEECIADFNRIGQLLDARYGRAGGDGVFEEYNVELYVTVPCRVTDSDRARVRNNIRQSSFRSSVTILARVEAVAAPRLHWAFQNEFIHKGDTILVLSCTVSGNDLGAYDISNPKFSYKEHTPPQDISGGWPNVEQDFREWLSWAFGASLDSVDPLLLETHSEFMREFRSLYFLRDIKDDPKYVHCLWLDLPHDDINRGYYDIRSNCVLVSKYEGGNVKLVCDGDFLDVPYVANRLEDFLRTLGVQMIRTPRISVVPAAIVRATADLRPVSRKAQRNYGWIVNAPFRDQDPMKHRFWEEYAEQWYCRERLLWQIEKGQDIKSDTVVSTTLTIVATGQTPGSHAIALISHALSQPDYAYCEGVECHARIMLQTTTEQILKRFQKRRRGYGLRVTAEIALGHECGVLIAEVKGPGGAEVLGHVDLDFSEINKA